MPFFILDWVKKHWASLGIGLLLCWFSIGVNYAVFLKPSIKVSGGGKYIEAASGYEPTIAISVGSGIFGCAHLKAHSQKK